MSNTTATHTLYIDVATDDTLSAWQAVSFEEIDTDTAEAIADDQAYARDLIHTHVSDNGAGLGIDTYFRVRVADAGGSEWISDTIWAAGEAHEDADDIAWNVFVAAPEGIDISVVERIDGTPGRTITVGETKIRAFNGRDETGRPWSGYDLIINSLIDGHWTNENYEWIETASELRERLTSLIKALA